jgi:hypothetical protein
MSRDQLWYPIQPPVRIFTFNPALLIKITFTNYRDLLISPLS